MPRANRGNAQPPVNRPGEVTVRTNMTTGVVTIQGKSEWIRPWFEANYGAGTGTATATANATQSGAQRPKHTLSPAGRKRISEALKRRHAAQAKAKTKTATAGA